MTNRRSNNAFPPHANPSDDGLQKLLNCSLDVICTIDVTGRFVQVSKASLRVWGYRPEELIGRLYTDFVVKEDLQKTEEEAQKIMQGEYTTHFQNRYLHKDGRIILMEWSGKYEEEEKAIFCIGRDLGERNVHEELQAKYEKMVKRQNTEMREILERITDGFFAMDEEWRVIYVNPRVEQMLEINKEDYLSKRYWDCFPEMINSVYYEQFHQAMHTKTPVHFEAYFPPFAVWLSVDAYPSKTGLSVFFRDCTQQMKIEEERKEYERKIKAQQHAMVEVLEQMSEGFVSIGKNGEVLYWNKTAELLSGVPREAILHKIIWEVYPYIKETEYFQLFLTISATSHPIHTEIFSKHVQRWVELHLYPTEHGISVFFKDITESKNAEEERFRYEKKIEQQNKQLIDLIERMKEGFYFLNKDFRVEYWNKQMATVSGVPAEKVLGKVLVDMLPDKVKAFYEPLFHQVMNDQKPFHKEFKCPLHDNWIDLSIYPSGEGLSVFITNIDQRKKAEEELRKLSLVAQLTDNMVALTSPDRHIIWVNAAFTRITGYRFEEVVGKRGNELCFGAATDPAVINYINEKLKSRQSFHIEEVLSYKKNGETYWADISCHPVFDENGVLQHFFSIATDITQRKKMQKVLDEEKAKRQQIITSAVIAAQEKERAQVGQELHDNINQVLTTIKLYLELYRDGLADSKDILNKAIRFLQESINEIRSLSKRLSAPTLGNIKLKDSVKELLETISATNKIAFTLDATGIEELEVDQEVHLAIYRILQEQLTNILKHSGADEVKIVLDFEEGVILLRVKDNGKGFNFCQKRNGIGITNMTTRAQSLKGTLTINSSPGKGCELVVKIPVG